MNETPKQKRIYESSEPIDLMSVKCLLEAHGIEVTVGNRYLIHGDIPACNFASPYLDVPESSVELALQLLAARSEVAKANRVEAESSRSCPACGETNPANFGSCWSCGAEFAELAGAGES